MYQAARGSHILPELSMQESWPLSVVRHPIMVSDYGTKSKTATDIVAPPLYIRSMLKTGFLLIFWGAPKASRGRVLYATSLSAYILVAVLGFEEPALRRMLGGAYELYSARVPSRFLPV